MNRSETNYALRKKIIMCEGTYTFTHEQPVVSAYIAGGTTKGFSTDMCTVKVWSLYFDDEDLMLHVFDRTNDDMHSANIHAEDISDAALEEINNLIELKN